jgi:ribosomal protein S27E
MGIIERRQQGASMQVRCFDCNRNDWMVKFHHEANRSFCDGCYQKRIQPERSKREDLLNDLIDAHQDVEFLVENCPCDVCVKISKMRCSEHYGNIVREVR